MKANEASCPNYVRLLAILRKYAIETSDITEKKNFYHSFKLWTNSKYAELSEEDRKSIMEEDGSICYNTTLSATSGTGKRSNKWSFITIRIALAIYSRSPAAYDALKSSNVLQLPSKSTLQAYTGVFIHDPGANNQSITDQVSQFIVPNEERKKAGLMDSKIAGTLIFYEVKARVNVPPVLERTIQRLTSNTVKQMVILDEAFKAHPNARWWVKERSLPQDITFITNALQSANEVYYKKLTESYTDSVLMSLAWNVGELSQLNQEGGKLLGEVSVVKQKLD
uniref:Uncharacterized protein n=1 Tax=Amphimedon queenslandica TaxID=400682 RepID=A0A1X7U450_AMPQE